MDSYSKEPHLDPDRCVIRHQGINEKRNRVYSEGGLRVARKDPSIGTVGKRGRGIREKRRGLKKVSSVLGGAAAERNLRPP